MINGKDIVKDSSERKENGILEREGRRCWLLETEEGGRRITQKFPKGVNQVFFKTQMKSNQQN